MKLLFDQNISFRIVSKIIAVFPESAQVRSLGLENERDQTIWRFAKENEYCIVTFDSDFIDMAMLNGHPPKILWLKFGNSGTLEIAKKLTDAAIHIKEFLSDGESAFSEIL